MTRGEIWWGQFSPPTGNRPVVLVSRTSAYQQRDWYIVVPVTTRARGIPAEVSLGSSEGLRKVSVANCDSLLMASRRALVHRLGALQGSKLAELDEALRFALGLDS